MAGLRVPKDTYKPGDLEKLLEKSGQVNYQSAGAGIYILTSQQNSPSSPNLEYFILLQSFEQYKGRTKWCFNDCMYCIPPPKLFSYHPFVNIHKHFSLPFLFIPPQIHPCFSISAKNFPSLKGRGKWPLPECKTLVAITTTWSRSENTPVRVGSTWKES